MKNIITILVFILFSLIEAQAQHKYGLQISAGMNDIIIKDIALQCDMVETYNSKIIYKFGGFYKYKIPNHKWAIGAEVGMAYRSAYFYHPEYWQGGYMGPESLVKVSNNYFELPIVLSYSLNKYLNISSKLINSFNLKSESIDAERIIEYNYHPIIALGIGFEYFKNIEIGAEYSRSIKPFGELNMTVDAFYPEKGITFYYQTFELYFCYNLNQFFKKD